MAPLVPTADTAVPASLGGPLGIWIGAGGAATVWEGAAGPDPKFAQGTLEDLGGGTGAAIAAFATAGLAQPASTSFRFNFAVRRTGSAPAFDEFLELVIAAPDINEPGTYLLVGLVFAPAIPDDTWQDVEVDFESLVALDAVDWSGAILIAVANIADSGDPTTFVYGFRNIAFYGEIPAAAPGTWEQVARPAGAWAGESRPERPPVETIASAESPFDSNPGTLTEEPITATAPVGELATIVRLVCDPLDYCGWAEFAVTLEDDTVLDFSAGPTPGGDTLTIAGVTATFSAYHAYVGDTMGMVAPIPRFQRVGGTGTQGTITVTFSQGIKAASVTVLDPDFAGDRLELRQVQPAWVQV